MDGNPLLNPVGSLPPQVYWRRRAMTGVVVLLVVWFAWNNVRGGAHAAPPAKPKTTAAPAVTPAPATTPAAAAPVTTATTAPVVPSLVTSPAPAVTTPPPTTAPAAPKCTDASLQATLTADKAVYPAGALPHFVITLTNVGPTDCRVDVGTANRGFVVTSGSDRIWSSSDCTTTASNVQVFKPKDSVGYAHDWGRARSTAAGCAAAGTSAKPGTYKVIAHVGDLTTAPAVFRLS